MWFSVLAAACFGKVRIARKRNLDKTEQTDFSENI